MADGGVNADAVIGKLREKVGNLVVENALLETALEEAWAKAKKLEESAAEADKAVNMPRKHPDDRAPLT